MARLTENRQSQNNKSIVKQPHYQGCIQRKWSLKRKSNFSSFIYALITTLTQNKKVLFVSLVPMVEYLSTISCVTRPHYPVHSGQKIFAENKDFQSETGDRRALAITLQSRAMNPASIISALFVKFYLTFDSNFERREEGGRS